jgi:hypothetical protein
MVKTPHTLKFAVWQTDLWPIVIGFLTYCSQDWTLICVWLTMVFTVIYFIFGDFFTDNYEIDDVTNDIEKKNDMAK